jgi:P2-related tail formation protein
MEFKMEISTSLGKVWKFEDPEEEKEALRLANQIIQSFGLKAEMLPKEHMSRGAQGDEPTYTRIILLTGPLIDQNVLAELSTSITNKVPVNKILFEIRDERKNLPQ